MCLKIADLLIDNNQILYEDPWVYSVRITYLFCGGCIRTGNKTSLNMCLLLLLWSVALNRRLHLLLSITTLYDDHQ